MGPYGQGSFLPGDPGRVAGDALCPDRSALWSVALSSCSPRLRQKDPTQGTERGSHGSGLTGSWGASWTSLGHSHRDRRQTARLPAPSSSAAPSAPSPLPIPENISSCTGCSHPLPLIREPAGPQGPAPLSDPWLCSFAGGGSQAHSHLLRAVTRQANLLPGSPGTKMGTRPERLCCAVPTTRGQSGPAAGRPGGRVGEGTGAS